MDPISTVLDTDRPRVLSHPRPASAEYLKSAADPLDMAVTTLLFSRQLPLTALAL